MSLSRRLNVAVRKELVHRLVEGLIGLMFHHHLPINVIRIDVVRNDLELPMKEDQIDMESLITMETQTCRLGCREEFRPDLELYVMLEGTKSVRIGLQGIQPV